MYDALRDGGAVARKSKHLTFGPIAKGFLINEVTLEKLIFQFNPAEITDSRTVAFEKVQVPGLSHPFLQFAAGDGRILSFVLEFSSVGYKRDIMADIRWLQSLEYPQWGQGVLKSAPPRVIFAFGKLLRLRGVITSCQVTYKRWNPDLTRLLEASVNLDLEEYVLKSVDMWRVKRGDVDPAIADLVRRAKAR
ncbi:MAG TPA: hypothetical protein GXX51_05755 [Firmicutes bacterium]|nr:hypothetical protein [Bacillota bacterium]